LQKRLKNGEKEGVMQLKAKYQAKILGFEKNVVTS